MKTNRKRTAKSPKLDTAIEKLREALERGTQDFLTRSDNGRAAAILQLDAAIDLIDALAVDFDDISKPDPLPSTLPLSALLLALNDLDFGLVGPIVTPSRVRTGAGRPSDTSPRKLTQLRAALTMQLLMEIGLRRMPAATAVAKVLKQGGVKLKRRGEDSIIDANAVIKWREQIQKFVRGSPQSLEAALYHRDLDSGCEQIDQTRRDGVDLSGVKITVRVMRNRILGHLAMFLSKHGETADPTFGDWLWMRRAGKPEEPNFD
jgi:hypothetical protein